MDAPKEEKNYKLIDNRIKVISEFPFKQKAGSELLVKDITVNNGLPIIDLQLKRAGPEAKSGGFYELTLETMPEELNAIVPDIEERLPHKGGPNGKTYSPLNVWVRPDKEMQVFDYAIQAFYDKSMVNDTRFRFEVLEFKETSQERQDVTNREKSYVVDPKRQLLIVNKEDDQIKAVIRFIEKIERETSNSEE